MPNTGDAANNDGKAANNDGKAARRLPDIEAAIRGGDYDGAFKALYPLRDVAACRDRYLGLINLFKESFGENGGEAAGQKALLSVEGQSALLSAERRAALISAPGRTEVCGNHTDHQHGNVLAAAIDLDIICTAVANGGNTIRIKSAGHADMVSVDLDNTDPLPEERGTATALIRGLASWFISHGAKIGGFDAYTSSDVLIGSGLSSSAAFEVAVGTAMNVLFDAGFTPLEIAIAGQHAENVFFGKPSGLMDQTASATGGFVKIDFADPKNPAVDPIQYDPSAGGMQLCVVNTKGSHADLIGEYASIPAEMRAVAAYFGANYLREADEGAFYANISAIRESLRKACQNDAANIEPDRAVLRAMHFFNENRLVSEAADALRAADKDRFLDCVIRSGQSSYACLQNIFAVTEPGEQGLSIALALSESLLRGKGGAWRVHGGGFAGTILAFVPAGLLGGYVKTLDAVFGEGSCITLSIRKYGGTEVSPALKG